MAQKTRVPRPKVTRGEAGFTIIELFVSLFVFSVGMTGVLALQTAIIKNNSLTSDISLASNLAGAQLEQLRITDYAAVGPNSTCPSFDPDNATELINAELTNEVCWFDKDGEVANADGRYFTRTWRATTVPTLDVKDVTVEVEWNFFVIQGAGNADNKTVTMTGRIYPRE